MRRIATAVFALFGMSGSAFAWGDEGHEAIALIAEHYLEPKVHEKVIDLLAEPSDPVVPSTMRDRATWADKYRESGRNKPTPNRYTETRQWHFVDLDVTKSAPDLKAACFGDGVSPPSPTSKGPASDCVVRKIEQFSKELGDHSLSKEERTLALMFLLHFVGDVHQPLHAAEGIDDSGTADAGANTVYIHINERKYGSNLHSFWDTDAVKKIAGTPEKIRDKAIGTITKDDIAAWTNPEPGLSAPRAWALESYGKAKSVAYAIPPDTQPCLIAARDGSIKSQPCHQLTESYMSLASEEAENKIMQAGVRLATLLNDLLR